MLSAIVFRDERRRLRREPRFTPPDEDEQDLEIATGGYAKVGHDDVFDDKHREQQAPALDYSQHAAPRMNPMVHQHQQSAALARPSVDAYGAFDGDMPGAQPQSRTMQMASSAYADPYAQVRAALDTPYQIPAQYTPPQPYSQPAYGWQQR